jgi:hypothetical protein
MPSSIRAMNSIKAFMGFFSFKRILFYLSIADFGDDAPLHAESGNAINNMGRRF